MKRRIQSAFLEVQHALRAFLYPLRDAVAVALLLFQRFQNQRRKSSSNVHFGYLAILCIGYATCCLLSSPKRRHTGNSRVAASANAILKFNARNGAFLAAYRHRALWRGLASRAGGADPQEGWILEIRAVRLSD